MNGEVTVRRRCFTIGLDVFGVHLRRRFQDGSAASFWELGLSSVEIDKELVACTRDGYR